ncbi:MAG: hypothetical protein ACYC61_19800 [Isosphaeraceae bacterium]
MIATSPAPSPRPKTSSARVEANRRNARKSTGPRTQAGKDRSRFNAVSHGLRSKQLILPGEDPAALGARMQSWTSIIQPQDDIERYLVQRAVNVSWQLDRADRAWIARLRTHVAEAAINRSKAQADEVILLGRRLFWDPRGPIAMYPFYYPGIGDPVLVSWMPDSHDPNDPARLVNRLESLAMGCAWLIDRWTDLKNLLEDGLAWQAPDRFRAIRLLGKQPLDAAEDETVLSIYLACATMDPEAGDPFEDIAIEFRPGQQKRFLERIAARDADSLAPASADEAREQLLALVGERIEWLEELLARHIERDEASSPADEAGFEDSEIGERLRRYLLANNRTLMRILDAVQKRRRERETDRSTARPAGRSAPAPMPSPAGPDVALADFPVFSSRESGAPQPARVPPAAEPARSRVEPASSHVPATPVASPTPEKATNEPNGRASWSAAARSFLGLMVVLTLGLLVRPAPARAGDSRVQNLSWQAVGAQWNERASCRGATPIPMKATCCVFAPASGPRIFRATQRPGESRGSARAAARSCPDEAGQLIPGRRHG